MFRPLAGRNQRIYADLLMLIWNQCGTSQDYSMGKSAVTQVAETYMEGLGTLLPLDEEDETDGPTLDARGQGLKFLRRLREAGWLEEMEGGYEEEPRTALTAQAVRLLQLFDEILHPKTVTYSGKLLKAYRLLQGVGQEKSPYENVLKEVCADMAALNTSLRQLNASIGGHIEPPDPHRNAGGGRGRPGGRRRRDRGGGLSPLQDQRQPVSLPHRDFGRAG